MYCGCNKTALSSLRSIADAFQSLLEEEPYSKISVSRICDRAAVSRQTFYSLFESKENIVAFILSNDYSFDPHEDCECSGTPTFPELCKGFAEYIEQKSDFIMLLERNNIIYQMQDCMYESFKCCIRDWKFPDGELSKALNGNDAISDLVVDYVASGLTTIAKHYVGNRDTITAPMLEKLIYDIFCGGLFE